MPLMAEQSGAHHVWAVVARSRPNPRATAPRGRGFPPGARGFFWCRRLDPALFTPRLSVGTVPAFFAVYEAMKPAANRVYHNNDSCHPAAAFQVESACMVQEKSRRRFCRRLALIL